MLTLERLNAVIHYDPKTGAWTWLTAGGKRRNRHSNKQAGNLRSDGRRAICVDYVLYLSSRLAVFYMTGEWPKNEVDHENLIRSDDRWENLREATSTQNNSNRNALVTNKLGVKGVRERRPGKFTACISVLNKQIHLGTFDSAEKARAAYLAAAVQHYGEFAR